MGPGCSLFSGPPPTLPQGYIPAGPPPLAPRPPAPPVKALPPPIAGLPKPLSEAEFLREKKRLIEEEAKYVHMNVFVTFEHHFPVCCHPTQEWDTIEMALIPTSQILCQQLLQYLL